MRAKHVTDAHRNSVISQGRLHDAVALVLTFSQRQVSLEVRLGSRAQVRLDLCEAFVE
jgi:hypothetical protein